MSNMLKSFINVNELDAKNSMVLAICVVGVLGIVEIVKNTVDSVLS